MKEQNTSRNIQNLYELSPMQAGMLFHSLLDKESNAYKEQYVFSLDGEINSAWLEKSFNILIERYDIFKTVFVYEELDEPVQVVLKERTAKMLFEDISHFPQEEKQKYIENFKKKDIEKGFDLSRDLLMRISLFKTGISSYKLVWTFHHIIMDGWCTGNVFKEWTGIYKGLKSGAGESPALKPVTQYKHYIKWLQQQDRPVGLKYWEEYLEGYERQTGLPASWEASAGRNYQSENYDISLDDIRSQHLVKIAGENKVTINILFQAMWGILLGKYNNTNDVVFGAVVSGRPPELEGIENMIGLFINTIPVRVRSPSHHGYSQLIRDLQQKTAAVKSYEYLPLAEIQTKSLLKGRLMDHILIFENYPIREEIKEAGIKEKLGVMVTKMEIREQTNYDFNIVIIPGRGFTVEFAYNGLAYDRDLIERAGRHLEQIVKQVTENTEIKIIDIEIITPEEKKQILTDFNQPEPRNLPGKSIHQLFAGQVERTPDNIALVGSLPVKYRTHITYMADISYRELNEKSGQLAYLLKEKGVQPDAIVAIKVEPSVEMIIAIFGILKAGSAYLPVDPGYPEERINYILSDSGVRILLAGDAQEPGNVTKTSPQVLYLSEVHHPIFPSSQFPNFPTSLSANLAYIIYTSGSTGRPKGVMVEHKNLTAYIDAFEKEFELRPDDTVIQQASFIFDTFVEELYPILLKGGKLVIPKKEVIRDIQALCRFIDKHQVTIISCTPRLLKEMDKVVREPGPGGREGVNLLASLRVLISGGDWLKAEYISRLLEIGDVYNTYGPTETTVCATYYKCLKPPHLPGNVPIGSPITNYKVYILDRNQNLQPPVVVGELCVSGGGVTRGYLNNPELTNQKLLRGPIRKAQSAGRKANNTIDAMRKAPCAMHLPPGRRRQKIYKTGDLARWRPDGKIEYIGRQDHQVKLRGYRIELGEIERQLLNHDEIKEAIVTARETGNGDKYLCAYVESKSQTNEAELREFLSNHLPDYMIPAYFIRLEKVPLTSTGKIDRNSLPEPEANSSDRIYTPPASEIEEKLIEIWQKVLGGQKIGTTDNFFLLGGDSIKAIQVSARIKKYQLELKMNDLFLHPTIKELAKYVTPTRQISTQEHNQGIVTGEVPLTPIQQWFFENDFTHRHHYNHAVMLYKKEGFEQTLIEKLFTQILTHHDVLRMVYRVEADQILQWNRGTDEKKHGKLFNFEVFRMTHPDRFTIEKEANRIQAGIDLTRGPLVKLGLFKTSEGDLLLIVIHHLVIDGISWRILFEDFEIGYQQLQQGEEIKFQEKTVSFRYWAQQLKEYSLSKEILRELEYWESIEKTACSLLPVDYQPGEKKKKYRDMETLRIDFDEKQTKQLLKEVHRPYNTNINDVLLTALGMAINEWSENETVVINLEGHGREPIGDNRDMDISRTIGWFTSQFPVLLNMNKAADLSTGIKLVKETLRRIPNKGIGYGVLRYLTSGNKKKGIRLRINPEISFNYLGQFHETNESSVFTFSPLPTGESVSLELETLYKIDINGLVKENMLTFSFNYSTCEYRKETIQQLAHSFKTNLVKIIEHCTGRHEKELTPSDLGDKELSLEELEDIKEMISL